MTNPEQSMLMYAQLAAIASQKRQPLGRDRFLVLTGVAATRAGWATVAERCRELVGAHSPRHLVTHYESFADALRDEEFAPFVRQTERFCPSERAEHLLSEMQISIAEPGEDQDAGALAHSLLSGL